MAAEKRAHRQFQIPKSNRQPKERQCLSLELIEFFSFVFLFRLLSPLLPKQPGNRHPPDARRGLQRRAEGAQSEGPVEEIGASRKLEEHSETFVHHSRDVLDPKPQAENLKPGRRQGP